MFKKVTIFSLLFFSATEIITAPRSPHSPGTVEFGMANERKNNTGFFTALKKSASALVEQNQGSLLSFLLILLLGLLMSFTPCIYPMIPITIGVLQATGTTSLGRTVLLALSYTCGISLTFATLGLIAAQGGAQFGALLSTPWFMLILVLFFAYLALSMLGFYDLYVPRFMQKEQATKQTGSLFSAFLFGALSGTIASPCVSPGLALLLGIAAQTKNYLLGFSYLFVFGLGLCAPLLFIGIFSKSLNYLPQAGMWMVEVKRFFGVLLLFTCFYYLSFITDPLYVWIGLLITILVLCVALVDEGLKSASRGLKYYRITLGILGISFVMISSLKHLRYPALPAITQEKKITYEEALKQATQENKPLLLEFGAQYCSLCRQVEKYFKTNEEIKKALKLVVLATIDGTDPSQEPAKTLLSRYAIKAYPTLVLVQPKTGQELARWSSEIMEIAPAEIEAIFQSTRIN